MRSAERIAKLPPYLFAELDKNVAAAKEKGVDVISFGIGDPDRPTPQHIVDAGIKELSDPANHRYPSNSGLPELREAIAAYYERRFNVALDPSSQVLPLMGSKEGIAHLATAFVDSGEGVLVQDPGYPVYRSATMLSGGRPISVPLIAADDFVPQLDRIPAEDVSASKVLWTNFPSNPTAAVCDEEFMKTAVDFCANNDLLLAHDAAYVELTYDGYTAPSVLQAPGALDVAVEFGSLSKTYNMTGWRIGWVVGSAQAVEAIGRVKSNIDSGIFNAVQKAGVAALNGPQDCIQENIEVYKRRRDIVVDALRAAGLKADAPLGAIYMWVPVPEGHTSVSFCKHLLEECGVVVAPGSGYGDHGEGFIRLSLTLADKRVQEGMERVVEALTT